MIPRRLAIALVVLTLGCGDDVRDADGTGGTVRRSLDAVLAQSPPRPDNRARGLDGCPFVPLDELVDAVDAVVPVGDDLPAGDDEAYVFGGEPAEGEAFGAGVTCTRGVPDRGAVDPDEATFLLVSVVRAPGPEDYLATIERYGTARSIDGPEAVDGGDRYVYCLDAGDPRFDACYADWFDLDAEVAVLVALGGRQVDPDDVRTAADAVLARIGREA